MLVKLMNTHRHSLWIIHDKVDYDTDGSVADGNTGVLKHMLHMHLTIKAGKTLKVLDAINWQSCIRLETGDI